MGAALASPSSPTPTRKVIALPPEKNVITTDEHPASMSNPSVFLSYVHDDDDYFDGLLIAFTKKVIQACRSELGTPVELITDNISLAWGGELAGKASEGSRQNHIPHGHGDP